MSVIDVIRGSATPLADVDVNNAYDKLSGALPKTQLQEGLTHAFKSDQTPPFPQMLASLFGQSNADQKASLLNQIATNIGPSAGQLAKNAGLGSIADALSKSNVTPQQALQLSSHDLQVLAEQAEKTNPSIVDIAAGFYAQHPLLVKTLGAGALALLMSKISTAKK